MGEWGKVLSASLFDSILEPFRYHTLG